MRWRFIRKRAAEITAVTQRRGFESYRARGIVARDTRERKRHEPVADLMTRWQTEPASVDWLVGVLERSVAVARARSRRPRSLQAEERRRIVAEVLAPDGALAARKVFSRRDAVAVALTLFGLEPSELGRTVDGVLADPEAIPLVATPMARERAYATATVIATEQAIAAAVDVEVARSDAPAVPRSTPGGPSPIGSGSRNASDGGPARRRARRHHFGPRH